MIDVAILEEQLLSLNRKERGRVASALIRSLDVNGNNDEQLSEVAIEKLWLEEGVRRNREMDNNPSIGRPREEVMRGLRSRFG